MSGEIVLTREQVRRIDELAQSRYGLSGIVLMENAGGGAARLIDKWYGPAGEALIVCGTGNNGGDGLVIGRHLHNAGWRIRILIVGRADAMSPDCAANDRVVQAMGIERDITDHEAAALRGCDRISPQTVVVDALLGTGFRGELRAPVRAVVDKLNSTAKRAMIAIDVPSGLDCDTGMPGGAAIIADCTITFVALKPGFLTESGRRFCGQTHLVSIGVPIALIESVSQC